MDQGRRIERGKLKAVSMGDGVRGAGFDAVTAKDAPVVVDVVDLGIAFGTGDSALCRVLGGLDVNAVGRTGCRTQKAGNTFFQAILIPLQHMSAAEAVLKVRPPVGARSIRVVFYFGWLQHLAKRDAHSLRHSRYVAHNGHKTSIRRPVEAPVRLLFGLPAQP